MSITRNINIFRAGWKFSPSDEELVSHYLKRFLAGEGNMLPPSLSHIMRKYDVYSAEPWNLPLNDGSLPYLKKQYETYFFTDREQMAALNKNGKRPKRSVSSGGFWRSSATNKPICDSNTGDVIGYLNNLCFHRSIDKKTVGSKVVTEEKTDWLMDEYQVATAGPPSFSKTVLCRIKYNGKPNSDASYADTQQRRRRQQQQQRQRRRRPL
ncbi:hypothetical protein ACFE04_007326 [Oxalis oulophora]